MTSSPPPSERIQLVIPATLKHLSIVGAVIQALFERIPDAETVAYNIQLAAQELCANIVNHAYAGKIGEISLEIIVETGKVTLITRDAGRGFTPDAVPAPDLDEPQVHGYGLFLIESLIDEINYETGESQNTWTLVKMLD